MGLGFVFEHVHITPKISVRSYRSPGGARRVFGGVEKARGIGEGMHRMRRRVEVGEGRREKTCASRSR